MAVRYTFTNDMESPKDLKYSTPVWIEQKLKMDFCYSWFSKKRTFSIYDNIGELTVSCRTTISPVLFLNSSRFSQVLWPTVLNGKNLGLDSKSNLSSGQQLWNCRQRQKSLMIVAGDPKPLLSCPGQGY